MRWAAAAAKPRRLATNLPLHHSNAFRCFLRQLTPFLLWLSHAFEVYFDSAAASIATLSTDSPVYRVWTSYVHCCCGVIHFLSSPTPIHRALNANIPSSPNHVRIQVWVRGRAGKGGRRRGDEATEHTRECLFSFASEQLRLSSTGTPYAATAVVSAALIAAQLEERRARRRPSSRHCRH